MSSPNDIDGPIVMAAAEIAPISKVGGLGEAVAGLANALHEAGHEVALITPRHGSIRLEALEILEDIEVRCQFGGRDLPLMARRAQVPEIGPPVWLLDRVDLFGLEPDPYGVAKGPTGLGHLKWLYFAAAIRPTLDTIGLTPRVLHLHDWHAAYAAVLERVARPFEKDRDTACVLTIHNGAFQGTVSTHDYRTTGLREDVLSEWHAIHEGSVNLLKAGTVFADKITTVSPTYASELKRAGEGHGLEYVFESREADFTGIVNGLDTTFWNPATDPALIENYDANDPSGKARCRSNLLGSLELDSSRGPVLAFIGRLTHQKGVDLILEALPGLLRRRSTRIVLLGRGDFELEKRMAAANKRFPGRFAGITRFDEDLAHRIEAGADLFLMPSRFEPCGLNQMISQRYGTLPVVHLTGGLRDTVVPWDDENDEVADGFAMEELTLESFQATVRNAMETFHRRRTWRRMMKNAMARERSWSERAGEYLRVYAEAAAARDRGERDDELLSHLRLEPEVPELQAHRPIPPFYEKDRLRLMLCDPRRIWASWEVQGEIGRPLIDGLSEAQQFESDWELRLTETESGSGWTVAVEGIAKNWFLDVEPASTYRAELWMSAPNVPARLVLTSNEVATPPETDS